MFIEWLFPIFEPTSSIMMKLITSDFSSRYYVMPRIFYRREIGLLFSYFIYVLVYHVLRLIRWKELIDELAGR